MSYSKIAKQQISKIELIIVSCNRIHKIKNKTPPGHEDHTYFNFALKGALVSSYAEVEKYIEIYVSEIFDKVLKKNSYVDFFSQKGSSNLKAYFFSIMFKDIFHQYSFKREEYSVIEKIINSPHFNGLFEEKPFAFSSKHLLDGRKFPSNKNIKTIGRRFGINNIYNSMSKGGGVNWDLKVSSLCDVRNGVAHRGELPQGYTSEDVINYIRECVSLIKVLDQAIRLHFKSELRSKDWKQVSIL